MPAPSIDLERCPKCGSEIYYYPACNEDGWRCTSSGCEHKPGEPPGFDPARDRALISLKVHGLLLDLHERGFIYCSNSSAGDGVTGAAADRCREAGRFDQYSIIEFIFASQASHGDYWKEISEGVLAGNDTRRRCPGGRLSTMSTGNGQGGWSESCFEKDCASCASSEHKVLD